MKRIIFIIILTSVFFSLYGLGAFNLFNQRNRPDLNWKEIETENCKIVYHEPLESIAIESAKISEETFITFEKLYKLNPKTKMILYVSDQDNIPNGATVLTHYIFIWVNQNDFTKYFSGNDKWLRKVISHEMSHWFVFNSIKDWMTPFLPISTFSFPQTFHEGYAQFFSGEPWGLNRGDRYLKTSVLSKKQEDPSGMYNGGLIYGVGFAMIRYLSDKYGEDSLIQLLKYRNKSKMYDFKDAFKNVYKKDFSEFSEEFRRHIYTYYYGQVYIDKANSSDTTSVRNLNDFKKLNSGYRDFSQMIMNDDHILFCAKKAQEQGFKNLVYAQIAVDSLTKDKLYITKEIQINKAGSFASMSLSANNQWVAYSKYSRHKKGRLAPRIFKKSLITGKTYHYNEGNFASIDNQGGIYFQRISLQNNQIFYLTPDGEEKIKLTLNNENQIGDISLSKDNTKLMVSLFDQDHEFKIMILNIADFSIIDALKLSAMPQNVIWNSNDQILFSVENNRDFHLDVYSYNLNEKHLNMIPTPPYNSLPISFFNNELFVLSEFYQGGLTLGKFNTALSDVKYPEIKENYYNKWIFIKPSLLISDSLDNILISESKDYKPLENIKWRQGYCIPFSSFVFGNIVLSEPLGKHMFVAGGYIPYDKNDQPYWVLFYQNNCFYPTIQVMSMNSRWFSGFDNKKMYYQILKKSSINFQFPINMTRSYSSANVSIAYSYNDIKNECENYSALFKTTNFSNIDLNYNFTSALPWKNSDIHPVRLFSFSYNLQTASDKIGMGLDYNQHSLDGSIAYAPFLFNAKNEQIRTLSFESRNHYEFVNGDQLPQFMPGIDEYEMIQFANKPAFKRYFLRGYEETYLSKEIFNSQNEIRIKLTDNLNFMAGWDGSLLSAGYVGVTLWSDYTKISRITYPLDSEKEKDFKANGFELKIEANILGFNTIHKFGSAYDETFKKLTDYYLLEIPIPMSF